MTSYWPRNLKFKDRKVKGENDELAQKILGMSECSKLLAQKLNVLSKNEKLLAK